jgi:hypothetical protein
MILRFWYNWVGRHFWYQYFNWRRPHLPNIYPGKITEDDIKWARDGGG